MTIAELFTACGLLPNGPTPWGEPIQCDAPGVYVVTQASDPEATGGLAVPAGLDAAHHHHWLSDQSIVYIGKAGGPELKATLRTRVRQFYRHKHGERSPHRGGQDVKLLLEKRPLWLFWTATPGRDPRDVERQMLAAFVTEAHHRPFANRQD